MRSVARLRGRAVTIDALDFNAGADFTLQPSIAVGILLEVAVDAVHPFFQVNVQQVDGHASRFGGDAG